MVRRAAADGYVVVTQDSADSTLLMECEPAHPGLVCITVTHGLVSLRVQQALLWHALARIADIDLAGRVVVVALTADRSVHVDLYPSTRT